MALWPATLLVFTYVPLFSPMVPPGTLNQRSSNALYSYVILRCLEASSELEHVVRVLLRFCTTFIQLLGFRTGVFVRLLTFFMVSLRSYPVTTSS